MTIKASNLVAVSAVVALGAMLFTHFQCSARQDLQGQMESIQKSRAARMDCALNPETCPPAPR